MMQGKRGMNAVKKYVAIMIALVFLLQAVSVYAAASFTLDVSVKQVQRGGTLVLSGTVPNDDNEVVVKIVRPNQTTFYIDSLIPAAGQYAKTIVMPTNEFFAPYGEYKVVASNGDQTLTGSFVVPDPNGGAVNPPTDGTVTNPVDQTAIPNNAGTVNDSTILPDKAANGSYRVGAATWTQAINNAKDAITIQLPVSTTEAGAALEFPAQSLKELKDSRKELIIIAGSNTLRFPADALAVADEGQARVRIDINSAWTSDEAGAINGSLQANADYRPTGVIISVVINVIAGNNVAVIHELGAPATVGIKLTAAQKQAISLDLAGVYYVDGDKVEYAGGKLIGDTMTFTAEHFSNYTILEYNKTFADLRNHWANHSVQLLAAKQIVFGVDDEHYLPNQSITRAEFVAMLMRALNWDGNGNTAAAVSGTPFSDVAAGKYYARHVAEAAALGIVSGYNGAFRPDDQITREEAVVALVRAVPYFTMSQPTLSAPVYSDAQEISAWATVAVQEASVKGLVKGDGTRFHPKQAVTRAEVAVMLGRLLTNRI
jgi:hypothetical protein